MTKIPILETPEVTMWLSEEENIVCHRFHSPITGIQLRDIMLQGIAALKKYQSCKWLSDDRKNSSITLEDREWGEKVFLPQATAAGWKFWAIVLPENIIGQINMKYIAYRHSLYGIISHHFSTSEAAMDWLVKQKP